ncbi:lysophospholipase, putative [Plasmodium vinckei vinckei]|uniref:Lysophospholipase, putative n=1 Tax=Plasmodium vinckei vinckei TaxID=54757 RepID=A0A449BRW6_PLAVN|nr:lysophospholipase, putative [Plasmodium vinckei vinckei]VEV56184.1 lysophospholipase, putative [Plasmodium vinckei vinckei]
MMEEIELNNDELKNPTVCKLDGDPKIGWLRNKNGLLLKTYGWLVKNAIGIILLIHGYKGHARLNYMKINLKMPNGSEDLVVDNDNYYIYKDSWIEKFNQSGYSVYGIDLQGHGESQAQRNVRGDFSSLDDLADDVLQYMNQIQDEISNDNQTYDKSHDIVTTNKKRLPIYIIGYSMGGNIALRILQLLNKEKGNNINTEEPNNYKKCNIMLDNSTDINEIDNDIYGMHNYNDYGSYNSYAIASDKDERCYNDLDKLNIKGCVSLSGMVRLKTLLNSGNKSFKYFYLPLANLLSFILPNKRIFSKSAYNKSDYVSNVYKHDKFINTNGIRFKCMSELIKATLKLDCNIDYLPKDIPLLFIHSTDDTVCSCKGSVLFYDKVNVNKKELHIVNGMNHAITIRPGNEDILEKIIDWIYDLRMNDEDELENG